MLVPSQWLCQIWTESIKYCGLESSNRGRLQTPVSQCIHKISKCHKETLENKHRDPIINRVHLSTKVNGCIKYEHNPFNTVGCRAVTRAGQTDEQLERQFIYFVTLGYKAMAYYQKTNHFSEMCHFQEYYVPMRTFCKSNPAEIWMYVILLSTIDQLFWM